MIEHGKTQSVVMPEAVEITETKVFVASNIETVEQVIDGVSVEKGVQALLRAQMIADYNHYSEKGFAQIYAKENFENLWAQYHALGANGVMDDIHERFKALPTQKG